MSAKKRKPADPKQQLSLPFGQPENHTAANEDSTTRIISFQERRKGKNAEIQSNQRKAVIQKLLDHARTLRW
jgi:hypothetical protein